MPLANPVCAAWPTLRPTKIKVWTCGAVQVACQPYCNPRHYPNYVAQNTQNSLVRVGKVGDCSNEQFNQVLFMCPLLHTGGNGMTPCGWDCWKGDHDICPYIEGFSAPAGTLESRLIVDEACKDHSSKNPQVARFIFARPVRTRYLAIKFVEASHFVPPKHNNVYGNVPIF